MQLAAAEVFGLPEYERVLFLLHRHKQALYILHAVLLLPSYDQNVHVSEESPLVLTVPVQYKP